MISSQKKIIRFAIALCGFYLVLSIATHFCGDFLIRLQLPIYSAVINLASSELQLDSIALKQRDGENRGKDDFSVKEVVAVVHNTQAMQFQKGTMPANIPIKLSTPQGYPLQHPLIIFSILLAWPYICGFKKLLLLLISVPFLLLVSAIDIPFVLLGSGYDLIYSTLEPQLIKSSWYIGYMDFLNGGGRIALSIAAAILCIGLLARIFDKHA